MEEIMKLNFRPLVSLLALVLMAIHGRADEPMPSISVSSTYNEQYLARYAVDGNPETRWASAPDDAGYLLLDFGQDMDIDQMEILWEHAYAAEYQIEVAGADQKWSPLVHQKNGQGGTATHANLKARGRYLRMHGIRFGPHPLWSIWELRFSNPRIMAALKQVREVHLPRMLSKDEQEVREKLAGHGVREIVFSTRADGQDDHWYANLGYWSYDENAPLYGKGGRLCKLNLANDTMTVLIDDPEGTIRDPTVHYDAEKILFSWRRGGTRVFHLYECDLAGGSIRQITGGEYDDIEPCYLPDGGIVFVSSRAKRYVNCWLTQVATLHRCDADPSAAELCGGGKNVRELSANIEHDNTPWVLPDGRVMYQRWEYIDRSQIDYHHLWTMNPDGTGQMVYYGNLHPGSVYIDAKPIPGTDKVLLINSPGHGLREHSGAVAVVSNAKGPDDRSALKNLSKSPDFRDPWPLSETLFLVARGREILSMTADGQTTRLYALPGEYGGVNVQEPRPVIRRERERVMPSRVDLSRRTGQLILTDVYFGRHMQGVNKGDIHKLLVLEALPKPINFTGGMDPLTYGGSFTLERVVGTIPVEADGSAFLELPANRSFFFVALDKDNNSVKRMQSFLTVMPGEVQGCVGCHETRRIAPVYKAAAAPLMALARAPSTPEPIPGIPDVFDYPRDIQPILDKHCIRCHDADQYKGRVILTGDRGPMFSLSYMALTVKKQIADGRNLAKSNYPPRTLGTSASPLMKKIDGRHHEVKVSEHEANMIRYWIESAACYPGTYAAMGHGSLGGYQKNEQIHRDDRWPTAGAFQASIQNRCVNCHQQTVKMPLPRSMSDEMDISFWRFNMDDERLRFSRHLMFNLTRPEKSLLLLAPLSKAAGGLDLCGAGGAPVFADAEDSDYQAMFHHILAGKNYLEKELTRFDMPNFMPRIEYFREMKRYGILPASFDPANEKFDVYEMDRKYWESLWYAPVGTGPRPLR